MNILTVSLMSILLNVEDGAGGGDILGSKPVTGLIALLADLSTAMLIIAPTVALVAIGYCAIRKMGADEQKAPMWKDRMVAIGVALVIVFSASALIAILANYFR